MSGELLQRLIVAPNGRHLAREDGMPFFWLGDTAWELFHKLDREEAETYLRARAAQRFNVVQAVALAEFDGVATGNAYGRKPLGEDGEGGFDPGAPDTDGPYSYWDHVDYIVDSAASLGIYIAFLPTWGDKFHRMQGIGPEIFTPDNAYAYGLWLGRRYRDRSNLVWVLGGDRPLRTRRHFDIVGRMAQGLKDGDGGRHLMTYHPKGAESSSYHWHDASWLDFHMIQSGHGEAEITNDVRVAADYAREPVKPVLDGEPCYEDIPIGFRPENGYFDEADVRRAAYYAVFSGACGHTYGHHSIWSMADGMYASVELQEPGSFFIMSWREALGRPGAGQMRHLRSLAETYGQAEWAPDPSVLAANFAGAGRMAASGTATKKLVYCPFGLYADIRLEKIRGEAVSASWYCPREGVYTPIGTVKNTGIRRFNAPSSGRGRDWVLCLEGCDHVQGDDRRG